LDKESDPTLFGKMFSSNLCSQIDENKVRHLRLSGPKLKGYIGKRYDKALTEKIYNIIETRQKNIYNIDFNAYIALLDDLLLSPCHLEKGCKVPNYLKFLFMLLDQGDKNFVCEHDLFQFMQSLTYSKKGSSEYSQTKEDEKASTLKKCNLDMRAFIPQKTQSLFMDAFAFDCILILKNMKAKRGMGS